MILQNEFVIRCHAIALIMTEPRSGKGLSVTCLDYVHKWIKSQPEFYNRVHQIDNKYLEKGLYCEPESIVFANRYYGWGGVEKNTIKGISEYIMGECDLLLPHTVDDIKNSWSDDTFPLFAKELPDVRYWWQMQGYMLLYNRKLASVIYTLMDAPDYMIEKEAWRQAREIGMEELEEEFYQEVKRNMTYSNFPDHLRVKRFFIHFDPEVIQRIIQRVIEIRLYIKNLSEVELFKKQEIELI